jgi:hypothetical protein
MQHLFRRVRPIFLLLSALLCLFYSVCVSADIHGSLEGLLDKLLHREMLLTISGIKPVSFIGAHNTDVPTANGSQMDALTADWFELIRQSKQRGLITNSNIRFWFEPESHKSGFSVFNEAAINHLINDPIAMQVLDSYRVPRPNTVAEAIDLYIKAVRKGGYVFDKARWANATVGIFLGFPPTEVAIYVRNQENPNGPPSVSGYMGSLVPDDPEFSPGFYANFTNLDLDRKNYLVNSGRKVIQNYLELRTRGLSNLEIFNHAYLLQSGVRPYLLPLENCGLSYIIREILGP